MAEGPQSRDLLVEFLLVDVPTDYNVIIGPPLIHDTQAIVSTKHMTMIYTSNSGKPKKLKKIKNRLGHVT